MPTLAPDLWKYAYEHSKIVFTVNDKTHLWKDKNVLSGIIQKYIHLENRIKTDAHLYKHLLRKEFFK
jgi:hypothetical protein